MNKPQPFSYTITINRIIPWKKYHQWFARHWFKVAMVALLLHLLIVKDVNISIQFKENTALNTVLPAKISQRNISWLYPNGARTENTIKATKKGTVHKAQSFYNLTFILSPDYATRKGIPVSIVNEKKEIVNQYLQRFTKIALEEQQQYGIPASITLAQALLESNAGYSRLATESKNHFGIKCKAKCGGCTCRNYEDDDFYDMFRVFDSVWESYRAHSILLSSGRYKHLKDYGQDYKKWAHGLKKAGYATDKKYANKLIKIIETLELYE